MVTLQLVQLLRVIVGMQAEDGATDELWYGRCVLRYALLCQAEFFDFT